MEDFRSYLKSKGYETYIFDCSKMVYRRPDSADSFSSMGNLDVRLFHKKDPIIKKIDKGFKIKNSRGNYISYKDREREIVYGLHELGKPLTLIHPRPNMKVSRIINGKKEVSFGISDDDMNAILHRLAPCEIYKAMFDTKIVLKLDC